MRSHVKSHTGCVQCRKKRVKCDEKQPTCIRCLRRDSQCTYTVVRKHDHDSESPKLAPYQNHLTASSVELELMHHFTLHTSKTCGQSMMPQDWWQETLPILAIRHDHLLCALFAFAGFHIASLKTEQSADYVARSTFYRDRALRILPQYFSPDQLEPEQVEACFWSSCLIGLVHLAEHQLSKGSLRQKSAKDMLLELARLWRGADNVGEMGGAVNGSYQHSNHYPDSRRVTTESPASFDEVWSSTFSKARGCVKNAVGLDTEVREIFIAAIDELIVAICQPADHISGAVLSWVACLDNRILKDLARNDEAAPTTTLANFILLLYGPALHLIRDLWYVQDLGARLVEELTSKIPLRDRNAVRVVNWAREQVCG